MVFAFDRANAANVAAALVDFELAFPCRGAARHNAPLFTQDGQRKAWTASAIDRALDGVMAATLTPAERQHKTFLSKRVWLASALTANKLKDGEIRALCRWRSTDSIRIYGRMDMAYQARCREAACSARFSALNATSLIPVVEPIRYGTDGAPLLPTAHEVEWSRRRPSRGSRARGSRARLAPGGPSVHGSRAFGLHAWFTRQGGSRPRGSRVHVAHTLG